MAAGAQKTELAGHAVALAAELAERARTLIRPRERREAERLRRMMADDSGKAFTVSLADRLHRSADPRRAAEAFRHLVRQHGIPEYLGLGERLLLLGAHWGSLLAPGPVMAAMRRRLRAQTRRVIVSGEPRELGRHLALLHGEGFSSNVNLLGEAVLGEEEARRRLEANLLLLRRRDVRHLSLKLSAIHSQIDLLAFEETAATLRERFRQLLRAAMADGVFLTLDMEEYRDLALTVEVFRKTLEEPEFRRAGAGLALQAYLPDSWEVLRELSAWARQRTESGGVPPRVRLVKGANLAMESVEAELAGWSRAPYETKAETDANFCRLLEHACGRGSARHLQVGVGSHNVFDVALALVLREAEGTAEHVQIEMLQGMAPHLARAVRERAGSLLLYTPVVREADFPHALAYLVRRLDENTAPGNFLREMFSLEVDGQAWERQRQAFLESWAERHQVSSRPRRGGLDRALPPAP